MNFDEFRNSDIRLNGKGYTVTISAEARARFRRIVRLSIVALGGISAAIGSAITVYSLLSAETLLPVVICALCAAYTFLVSRKGRE